MPQGTNSTMCAGQAKHYQLCQQQVRTTSSTDWSLLGHVGVGGGGITIGAARAPTLRVQLVRQRSADKGYDPILEWSTVVAFEDVGDGLYSLGLGGGGKGYKNIFVVGWEEGQSFSSMLFPLLEVIFARLLNTAV